MNPGFQQLWLLSSPAAASASPAPSCTGQRWAATASRRCSTNLARPRRRPGSVHPRRLRRRKILRCQYRVRAGSRRRHELLWPRQHCRQHSRRRSSHPRAPRRNSCRPPIIWASRSTARPAARFAATLPSRPTIHCRMNPVPMVASRDCSAISTHRVQPNSDTIARLCRNDARGGCPGGLPLYRRRA